MMESNPGEAIKNNVFGTKIVADAALATGCRRVRHGQHRQSRQPHQRHGAAKRFAELYIQSSQHQYNPAPASSPCVSATCSAASGSVVPIFRKQIEAGGPVTVTHPDMKRYFMTIAEASQLVMQAGAIGQGGEIFILDMGEPMRFLDLAKEMIRRHGLVPDKDIAIEFTGVRPAKNSTKNSPAPTNRPGRTSHPKIRVWQLPRTTGLIVADAAEKQ